MEKHKDVGCGDAKDKPLGMEDALGKRPDLERCKPECNLKDSAFAPVTLELARS